MSGSAAPALRAGRAALACTLVALSLLACSAPEPAPPELPLAVIQPLVRIELVELPPGPVQRLWVRVLVEPSDGLEFTLAPVAAGSGRAVVDLRVRWQDFTGEGPTSTGHAAQSALEWAGQSVARPGQPAVITAQLDLGPVQGVLARRIDVEGRLIGVELRQPDVRSGGVVLTLPPAHLDSLAPAPAGPLAEHLQSGLPGGIFLVATRAPPEEREETLDRLIDALSASTGRAREAILAALLYLTGETHGRDAHLWRTWWNEQRQHGRR